MKNWLAVASLLTLTLAGTSDGVAWGAEGQTALRVGLRGGATQGNQNLGLGWSGGLGLEHPLGRQANLGILWERFNFSNNIQCLSMLGSLTLNLPEGMAPVAVGPAVGAMRFSMGSINGNGALTYGLKLDWKLSPPQSGMSWGADLLALNGQPGDRSIWLVSPGAWFKAAF